MKSPSQQDGEPIDSTPGITAQMTASMTPRPVPQPPIILLFIGIICGILFGVFKYVVEYNLCEILNVSELEFENVSCDFYFYDYGLCNGYYPTTHPISAAPDSTFYCNGIDSGLSANDILKGVLGADCNEYVFDNEINMGMFIFVFLNFFSCI